MRTSFFIAALALIGLSFTPSNSSSNLSIGDRAPLADHMLKDISGADLSLEKLKGENGLLVIFSCNTCPFVVGNGSKSEGWENRYNELNTIAEKIGVEMVLVNSNEAKRDQGDSFQDMVDRAAEMKYSSSYVMDSGHMLADAFGAKTTPHVFLFNKELSLIYQGAIDDNANHKSEVEEQYLQSALNALSMGTRPKVMETKPIGCSIKRVSK